LIFNPAHAGDGINSVDLSAGESVKLLALRLTGVIGNIEFFLPSENSILE